MIRFTASTSLGLIAVLTACDGGDHGATGARWTATVDTQGSAMLRSPSSAAT